jgi:hypothetical protein
MFWKIRLTVLVPIGVAFLGFHGNCIVHAQEVDIDVDPSVSDLEDPTPPSPQKPCVDLDFTWRTPCRKFLDQKELFASSCSEWDDNANDQGPREDCEAFGVDRLVYPENSYNLSNESAVGMESEPTMLKCAVEYSCRYIAAEGTCIRRVFLNRGTKLGPTVMIPKSPSSRCKLNMDTETDLR